MRYIPSIKSQLIKLLTIPLALFTIPLFIFIYFLVQYKVNNFFDNRLYASAKSIEQNIGVAFSSIIIDLPNFSIDLLSNNDKGLVYYSIVDDKNNLLIGHDKLFEKSTLKNNNIIFYTIKYDGALLKMVSYKYSIHSSGKEYITYISIGETTQERDENIKQVLYLLFTIIGAVIFFTIIISIIAIKRGLSPLEKLKNIVKNRDKRDLTPLLFDAPKEVEDVVSSINILLKRSRNTIDDIEQFNSDVSHQLRTPLSEMKVKLELCYSKEDAKFIEFNILLNNMAHITQQLLLYAKTNPNTINLTRLKQVCLNEVCKNFCLKIAPRVYNKGFEFAFEDLDERIYIKSDVVLLESMLDNIINNALHYARDENNIALGTITLSIERHNDTIWLNIKDEGYGVNKQQLKNIFKRYYRVDLNKQGSGLGLSIVKQIANIHNAKTLARNNKGLIISIIFKIKKSINS